jgi:hypothetical protein
MTGALKKRLHHQCNDDTAHSKAPLESRDDEQALEFFDESSHEYRGEEPNDNVDLSHEFLEQSYSFIENVGTHGFQDAADREVIDQRKNEAESRADEKLLPEPFMAKSDVARLFLAQKHEHNDKRDCDERVRERELDQERGIQVDLGDMPKVCEVVAEGRQPEKQDESNGDIV